MSLLLICERSSSHQDSVDCFAILLLLFCITKGFLMLPTWIDLSIPELLQSTGFVAMAIMVFTFQFLMPSSR